MDTMNLTERRALAYRNACADRGAVAFVAVTPDEKMDGINGGLGVAVANERGYHPVPLIWARYVSHDAAQNHADHLNESVLGLTDLEAMRIVFSTMGGRRYTPEAA